MKRLAIVFVFLMLAVTFVSADPVVEGLYFSQSLGGSLNPLGLETSTRLFYRLPLIREPGILWESTKVEFGLHNSLSPSWEAPAFFVKIEPIAVFDVVFSSAMRYHTNLIGFGFSSFPAYGSEYSTKTKQPGENLGFVHTITPTLKAQVGPVIFADSCALTFVDMQTGAFAGTQDYYHEATIDTLVKLRDFFFVNNTYLLYRISPELVAGFTNYLAMVPGASYVSDRIAALVSWGPKLGPQSEFSLTGVLGIFLADRYNAVSNGLVYIALQLGYSTKL